MGGNANTALKNDASDLATACDIPFNELVSLSEMETIEDKLNCNLYILNIRDLPLHQTNTHLHNMLLYFPTIDKVINIGCSTMILMNIFTH